MKPRTWLVREHLRKHKSITPLVALQRYGVFRLAARIGELREIGFAVETEIVRSGEKHFARYVLC